MLKLFGVAVTDFEAVAEKLKSGVEQFTAGNDKAEVTGHLENVARLCRELNTRWLQITQRVIEAQNELLVRYSKAADKAS